MASYAELAELADVPAEAVERLLAPYPISLEDIDWSPLEVREREFSLGPIEPRVKANTVTLKPESLNDVRRWVGVPSDVFAEHGDVAEGLGVDPPDQALRVQSTSSLRALSPEMQDSFQDAARRLVFGYVPKSHQRLPLYKAAIEFILANEIMVFLTSVINVYPGTTLRLEGSPAVVTAARINIYQGGTIQVRGHSTLNAVAITGGLT